MEVPKQYARSIWFDPGKDCHDLNPVSLRRTGSDFRDPDPTSKDFRDLDPTLMDFRDPDSTPRKIPDLTSS